MQLRHKITQDRVQLMLSQVVSGPQIYALLPAVILGAFWVGGEPLLVVAAIAMPLILLTFRIATQLRIRRRFGDQSASKAYEHDAFVSKLDSHLKKARANGLKSSCMLISIDDHQETTERFGHRAADHVAQTMLERVQTAIRNRDQVFLLDDNCIAIAVTPVRQFDLDVGLQLAARLQTALEEPVTLDFTTIYVSASIGFCLSSQLKRPTGTSLAHATNLALREAVQNAPSAIRCYSDDIRDLKVTPYVASDETSRALENGQIIPWFQPQISTDTGEITGFEALARWVHPQRGAIPPNEFLPVLTEAGKLGRLCEQMLTKSLTALKDWDANGLNIPNVGVNFSPEELRNPQLLSKIEWELDRFNLTPDRLVVEILETVVAHSPDDVVTRNINGLSALGCKIDLDDFGTGHASISSIRRFAIGRLKIDRSFVMKVDQDAEQQRIVSAILMMAERLELDTLAEGVETAGEHTMLAQLGCKHVQGFGLARPMPVDDTAAWIAEHNAKLASTSGIGRKFG
ncbi:MAG: putative bifunctional diguanylate cyclase/phosphodiesterase [Roseovarius sp.]